MTSIFPSEMIVTEAITSVGHKNTTSTTTSESTTPTAKTPEKSVKIDLLAAAAEPFLFDEKEPLSLNGPQEDTQPQSNLLQETTADWMMSFDSPQKQLQPSLLESTNVKDLLIFSQKVKYVQ